MSIHYVRKSFYSGLVFFGTILGLSIGYSALFGGLTESDKVGTGSGLTATAWNKIIDGVLDLDTRVSKFTFSGSNVGIGGISPLLSLDMQGTLNPGWRAMDSVNKKGITSYWHTSGGYATINAYDWTNASLQPFKIDGSTLSLNSWGNGNVGIGTITPQTTLDVNGPISSAGGKEVRNIFTWKDPSPTTRSTPLHIKTNWRTNNGAMYRFKIEGYLYGSSLPIDSECVGYLYNTTDSITNPLCKDTDDGITLTQYKSGDGYLVLKATPNTSWYYGGFGVSLQQFNSSGVKPLPTFTVYEQAANL